ncbi:MAG: NAD(P)H-hydrate dehydratase [Deltaproteobacteria bacterium]|nr:MAG: NAD(P)H-hydrate dehydratase [Deltaproteobacteria bacterium]
MKVSTVGEMRDLDRRAVEEFKIPEMILMENAGEAVYFVIHNECGIRGKAFLILCGIGNNGGDGFVVARKLHSNGGRVKVFLLGDKEELKGSAKENFDIISSLHIEIERLTTVDKIKSSLHYCDAVVDAIFGTGLTRDVGGIYREVSELINKSQRLVFSVDIPSGVNGNTGQIMGCAIKADYTITFGLPKLGNLLYPGFDLCGKLYVTHISFPSSLCDTDSIKVETNNPIQIPERAADTHKGDYGKALFIAGSSNYLGAPYFSALSFLKAGGGLSYLASPDSIAPFLANKGSEIVFVPQRETDNGSLSLKARGHLLEFSDRVDIVTIGPGLSLNEETQELVREVSKEIRRPLIIDGDGITAISRNIDIVKERRERTILTPHLGEMSRITEMDIGEIQKNRIPVLSRTCKELNAYIILKGAHTLIGYPDGHIFINMSGNPGMATAGSGDVLVGTIAAMFGLDLSIEDSTRMGVFIHGMAGDLAVRDIGADGIIAGDIMDYIPEAVRYCRENFAEITKDIYGSIYTV